jgi:hypothetical protein
MNLHNQGLDLRKIDLGPEKLSVRVKDLIVAGVLESEVEVLPPCHPETLCGALPCKGAVEVLNLDLIALTNNLKEELLPSLKMSIEGRRSNSHRASELSHGKSIDAVTQVEVTGTGKDSVSSRFSHSEQCIPLAR